MVETGQDPFAVNPLPAKVDQIAIDIFFGKGNTFPTRPQCEFQGKTLPTLCQRSEGDGISAEILTNTLKGIDTSGVLNQSKGVKLFFLYAHTSCFSLKLFRYVNNKYHICAVCTGVLYRPHLWQVADSEEANGELNRLFIYNKEGLLRKKSHHVMDPNIV